MGSLTHWTQENATRPSATALAHIKCDHLLAEGRQMPQGHQKQLLHLLNRITYPLGQANATRSSATALAPIKQDHLLPVVGKYHKAISNSSCTY